MWTLNKFADWWNTFEVVDGIPSYISQYGQVYDKYINGELVPEGAKLTVTNLSLSDTIQSFVNKLEEEAKKYNTRKICVRSAPSIEIFTSSKCEIRVRLHFIKEGSTLKVGNLEFGATPNRDNNTTYVKFIVENTTTEAVLGPDQLETFITYLKGVRDAMGWNKRYGA